MNVAEIPMNGCTNVVVNYSPTLPVDGSVATHESRISTEHYLSSHLFKIEHIVIHILLCDVFFNVNFLPLQQLFPIAVNPF